MNIIIVKIKKKEIVLTQFIYTTKKELMKKNIVTQLCDGFLHSVVKLRYTVIAIILSCLDW